MYAIAITDEDRGATKNGEVYVRMLWTIVLTASATELALNIIACANFVNNLKNLIVHIL